MRKFHRHGYRRFGGRPKALSSAIWLIGIGVLMLTGDWWPGILFLVGLSMIVEAVFKDKWPTPEIETESPPFQTPPPPPAVHTPPVVPAAQAEPIPATYIYRTDLLPANCPRCGGPVRSAEVKWTSSKSADCSYCGSKLPMRKD